MRDLISRQAAIDGKISIQRTNGVEIYSDEAVPVEYLKALPSAQPEERTEERTETHGVCLDVVDRQAVFDALDNIKIPRNASWYPYYQQALTAVSKLPSAQPDNRLERIADIVEGTIDHLDRDDAMDMLYQIKEVLK